MGEEKMTAKAPVQAAVTILVLCMGIGYEIWGLQQIDWSNPESIILDDNCEYSYDNYNMVYFVFGF